MGSSLLVWVGCEVVRFSSRLLIVKKKLGDLVLICICVWVKFIVLVWWFRYFSVNRWWEMRFSY